MEMTLEELLKVLKDKNIDVEEVMAVQEPLEEDEVETEEKFLDRLNRNVTRGRPRKDK